MLFVLETKQMPGSQKLGDTEREGEQGRKKRMDRVWGRWGGRAEEGWEGGSDRCTSRRRAEREGGREGGRILAKIHSLDSGGGSETQMWGAGAKASHS